MKIRRRRRGAGGFTLIELLLVVVIIGILAAIVVPKLTGRSEDARIEAARLDIKNIGTALSMYESDNGKFPTTDQGLPALLIEPGNPKPPKWKGPYLDIADIPKDPWGREYLYLCPGVKHPTGYDLLSAGTDGQPGSPDDIEKP